MLRKFAPFRVAHSYYFKNPENNWKITGTSFKDLINKIRLYRAQNEFPELEFLESVVEHYLCMRPENVGACESAGPLKRGIIATIKGGIVTLKNLMYNSFVTQAVADERSEICLNCPHNFFPDKGPFIEWSDKLAENSIGDRKSKHHDKLGNCEICSCPLRCKEFFAGKISLTQEELIAMPNYCWQKQEVLKHG